VAVADAIVVVADAIAVDAIAIVAVTIIITGMVIMTTTTTTIVVADEEEAITTIVAVAVNNDANANNMEKGVIDTTIANNGIKNVGFGNWKACCGSSRKVVTNRKKSCTICVSNWPA